MDRRQPVRPAIGKIGKGTMTQTVLADNHSHANHKDHSECCQTSGNHKAPSVGKNRVAKFGGWDMVPP
jgi:hypothetical protein